MMTTPGRKTSETATRFDQTVVELMRAAKGKRKPNKRIRLVSQPLARALKLSGTSQIYTDTADQDEAGFGDFFHAPTAAEWAELRKGKLPDLDSPLIIIPI